MKGNSKLAAIYFKYLLSLPRINPVCLSAINKTQKVMQGFRVD